MKRLVAQRYFSYSQDAIATKDRKSAQMLISRTERLLGDVKVIMGRGRAIGG